LSIDTIDAAIVVVYMAAVVLLGVWIGRGQRDLSGYLLGGRDLPWWAILGSIVATETSTATFLSVPGIAFASGGDLRFLQLAMGFILGRVVVAVVLLPLYFRGQIFSAYEVLDKRFGGATKQVASLMFLIARNLGGGLRLFLAGIALEKVIGIDLHYCIIAIGLATIVYTFFGGMKAVIWSDCLQFVIYMLGGLIALVLLIRSFPEGLSGFVEYGRATEKFRIFDFRWKSADGFSVWTEPYTIWAGVFGGAVLTLGTHGTDQMMVQRYLSARCQRDAARALMLSGLVVFVQFTLFLLLGVALAGFYSIVQSQTFGRPDEVFASYIVDYLPVGLIGFTLAAVFAAAMSTLSSSLNSSATAAVNDFYLSLAVRRGIEPSMKHLLRTSRRFTIFFGVVQIGVGIGASFLSQSVVSDALAIAGFTAGILLGVFLLGVCSKRANQTGVLLGVLAAIILLTYVKFATDIAWPWYAIVGALATVGVGYPASLITKVAFRSAK
jgi:SSS family solute:Na+ symporter